MKILIADAFGEVAPERIFAPGARCRLPSPTICGGATDRDSWRRHLVVRSKQVSAATIDVRRALALIVRAGAGVNTIDSTLPAVAVCSSPTAQVKTPSPLQN